MEKDRNKSNFDPSYEVRRLQTEQLALRFCDHYLKGNEVLAQELFGNGIHVAYDQEFNSRAKIAKVKFAKNKGIINFSQQDFRELIEYYDGYIDDSNQVASFYIGVGLIYYALEELIRLRLSEKDSPLQYVSSINNRLNKPPTKKEIETVFKMSPSNLISLDNHIDLAFENIMLSEDARMLKINSLRMAVAAYYKMTLDETPDNMLWPYDTGDRIEHVTALANANIQNLVDYILGYKSMRSGHKVINDKITNEQDEYSELPSIDSRKIIDHIPSFAFVAIPHKPKQVDKLMEILLA